MSEDPRKTVRRELIQLGDDAKFSATKVKIAVGRVEDDINRLSDVIVATVVECIQALPTKLHVYATYVGVINNLGHKGVVRLMLDKLFFTFQIALRNGSFLETQLIVRFLALLVSAKALQDSELFRFLGDIIELSNPGPDGDSKGSADLRQKGSVVFPIYMALMAIPFIDQSIQDSNKEAIANLIEKAENKMHISNLNPSGCDKINTAQDSILCGLKPGGEKNSTSANNGAVGTQNANGNGAAGGANSSSSSSGSSNSQLQTKLEFLISMIKHRKHLGLEAVQLPLISLDKLTKAVPNGPLQNIVISPEDLVEVNDAFKIPYWLPIKKVLLSEPDTKARLLESENQNPDDLVAAGLLSATECHITAQYREAISDFNQFFLETYIVDLLPNFSKDAVTLAKSLLRCRFLKNENDLNMHLMFVLMKEALSLNLLCQTSTKPIIPIFFHKLIAHIVELEMSCEEIFTDLVVRFAFRSNELNTESFDRLADMSAWYCSQADLMDRGKVLNKIATACNLSDKKEDSDVAKDANSTKALVLSPKEKTIIRGELLVSHILQRIVRLSVIRDVEAKLNDSLKKYLPAEFAIFNPYMIANWTANEELCPPCPEYQKLDSLIKIKDADAEMVKSFALKYIGTQKAKRPLDVQCSVIKIDDNADAVTYPFGYADDNLDKEKQKWTKEELFELLLFCFLQKGSRTPTHAEKLLEIHHVILRNFSLPQKLVDIYLSAWRNHPVRCELAMEQILVYNLATPAVIFNKLKYSEVSKFQATWNVVHRIMRLLLEKIYFLNKESISKQQDSNSAWEAEDLSSAELTYCDGMISLLTAIASGSCNELAVKNAGTDLRGKFIMTMKTYGGPRCKFLANLKDKVEAAVPTGWKDDVAACFAL